MNSEWIICFIWQMIHMPWWIMKVPMRILVFTDKVISKEDSNMMKEWMQMTKVERLFYEEKVQAVKAAKKVAKKEAKKETREEIAKSMLKDGVSIDKIMAYVKPLSREEIVKLQAAL